MSKGEYVRMTFFLRGKIPSKANRKLIAMRDRNGAYLDKPRYYLPRELKTQLLNLEMQARMAWGHRKPLVEVAIHYSWHMSAFNSDEDNRTKSVGDLLQSAGVIKTDSDATILRRSSDRVKCAPGDEGVQITVAGYEYVAPKKRRAA